MTKRQLRKKGFQVISRLFDALSEHGYENVIYRGHGDKSWQLVPSVYRPKATGISSQRQLEKWMTAAARFAQPTPQSSVEWLVLAQHYGIPTALLDWTVNPLIALFFAAASSPRRNGTVIMANRRAFTEWYYLTSVGAFNEERAKPGLVAATTMNARALAQDSVMSLHTKNYATEIPANATKTVFEIRMSEKDSVLEAMAALGYTKDRVFSDISLLVERFLSDPKL